MAEQISLNKPKTRLYFIDMARTIAILLMLEGHFVHDSLALEWVNESLPAYRTWKFIRGFTSPTFLTVTGLVFTYLLLGNEHLKFWENMRVRKGLKRVIELLFLGLPITILCLSCTAVYCLRYFYHHYIVWCVSFGQGNSVMGLLLCSRNTLILFLLVRWSIGHNSLAC